MARIFINNWNSYVSQAIFNEMRNDVSEDGEINDNPNLIFGTFMDKDSSEKPDGITKMLKVSHIHIYQFFSRLFKLNIFMIEIKAKTYNEIFK